MFKKYVRIYLLREKKLPIQVTIITIIIVIVFFYNFIYMFYAVGPCDIFLPFPPKAQ